MVRDFFNTMYIFASCSFHVTKISFMVAYTRICTIFYHNSSFVYLYIHVCLQAQNFPSAFFHGYFWHFSMVHTCAHIDTHVLAHNGKGECYVMLRKLTLWSVCNCHYLSAKKLGNEVDLTKAASSFIWLFSCTLVLFCLWWKKIRLRQYTFEDLSPILQCWSGAVL